MRYPGKNAAIRTKNDTKTPLRDAEQYSCDSGAVADIQSVCLGSIAFY
jgi:hypothetical protein